MRALLLRSLRAAQRREDQAMLRLRREHGRHIQHGQADPGARLYLRDYISEIREHGRHIQRGQADPGACNHPCSHRTTAITTAIYNRRRSRAPTAAALVQAKIDARIEAEEAAAIDDSEESHEKVLAEYEAARKKQKRRDNTAGWGLQ